MIAPAHEMPYGRLPVAIVESGVVRELTEADVKVLLAIAYHWRSSEWEAHPSKETIARLTGLAERSVLRALNRLEDAGVLEIQRGGGQRVSNVYRPSANSDPGVLTATDESPTDGSYSDPRRPLTATPESVYSDPGVARIKTEEKRNTASRDDAAADSLFRNGLIEALGEVGLRGATYLLDELDDIGELTPAIIRAAMADVSKNAKVGARVQHFRANIGHAIDDQRRREETAATKARQDAHRRHETAAYASQAAEFDEEVERAAEFVQSLETGLRARYREAVLAELPAWRRARLVGMDALQSKTLKLAIYAKFGCEEAVEC